MASSTFMSFQTEMSRMGERQHLTSGPFFFDLS